MKAVPREFAGEPSSPISLELTRVRRAAAGDASAQRWLVHQVMPSVRRIVRALATHASDADDAAQLALIEILRSTHTFRGRASVEAWATRIATRVALRHLSKERRRRHQLESPEDAQLWVQPRGRVEDDLPGELREYLDRLPEAQRTALVLRHALGHSLEEIAELTGVSKNTVKGRLRLGTGLLRKLVRRDLNLGRGGDR